jgi:hypothetical protein
MGPHEVISQRKEDTQTERALS